MLRWAQVDSASGLIMSEVEAEGETENWSVIKQRIEDAGYVAVRLRPNPAQRPDINLLEYNVAAKKFQPRAGLKPEQQARAAVHAAEVKSYR